MKQGRKRLEEKAAFAMAEGDRFHRIIVSDGVRYESDPEAETVITFFVVKHKAEFDIVNVLKTFHGDRCVSRNVQTKAGIPAERIVDEIDALRICFALAIEKATGYKLKWHEIDLSDAHTMAEQVARIKAWGRVGAWTAADSAPWN